MPELLEVDLGAGDLSGEGENGIDVGAPAKALINRLAGGRWGERLEDLLEEVGAAVGWTWTEVSEGFVAEAKRESNAQRKDEVKPSVRLKVRSSELFCQIRGMTLVLLLRER